MSRYSTSKLLFKKSPLSTSSDNGKNTGPMQTVLLAAATRGNPSGISRAAATGAGPGDHHPEEAEKADCWQGLDLQVAASGRAEQFSSALVHGY